MASHDYDAACWLLGQEPVEAYAARQSRVYPELEALGDLDNAAVTIRFDGGGIAATHVSRTCAFGHDMRSEVVGDEGSVLIGNAAVATGRRGDDGAATPRAFPQDYRERFADAYAAELAAFVAAVPRRRPAPGRASTTTARAVAIGVAARASAVDGVARASAPTGPGARPLPRRRKQPSARPRPGRAPSPCISSQPGSRCTPSTHRIEEVRRLDHLEVVVAHRHAGARLEVPKPRMRPGPVTTRA